MWGFERLLAGPSKGGYLHQHFKRGQPALCRYMKRLKIKGTGNKKPVQSPFETSSVPKVKSSTTRKSPGRVVSRGAAKSMYQCIPPESSCFAQVESDARSVSFPPFETIHVPVVRQEMLNACSGTIGHSPCNVDLFDEDTLASVLSTVLENPAGIENVPNEGDCVIFEGMQFFFVEEHRAPHASRRLSIGLGRGVVGAPNRRFSLVGAQTASSTPIGSVEPPQGYAASNHSSSMGRQRANRRFSLQRTSSSGSNAYILKQIVEI